ncbi:MAG: outer membrane beta-barrel protein [Candidatus Thermochlorobacter sp.]
MKKLIVFLALLFSSSSLFAQSYTVQGRIISETDKSPLAGAKITLSRLPDSVRSGAIANASGAFLIQNLSAGKYTLRVTYIGYRDYVWRFELKESVDLGVIAMKESGAVSDEIVVEERLPTAIQQGDTVQFNARAFKTNPDATAEDLISKMPGVTVQGGRVQAQGEQVRQVLVDGKPFFGEDPSAVLKNLPAEMIEKIQVFDQQSEQARFSGVEDGNTIKTINIVTKPAYRNGSFGRAYAGYGNRQNYKAGGNLNIFHDEQRISIIGQSNNINEQNFASEDLLGVASSSGAGGGRRGGFAGGRGSAMMAFGGPPPPGAFNNPTDNFLVSQQNGLITTHAFGLNYIDEWNKTTDISASYFFNLSGNLASTSLFRQFILPSQLGQTYLETNFADTRNINHRLNMRIDHKFSETTSILLVPRLTLQDNRGRNDLDGITAREALTLGNTRNDFASELFGARFSNLLLFRHRFNIGRTISLSLNTTYNHNDGESQLSALNEFFADAAPSSLSTRTDSLNQFSNTRQRGWGFTGNATYTEPLALNQVLQVTYTANYRPNTSNNETFSRPPALSDFRLDTLLSNRIESAYFTQSATAGYRFFTREVIFALNLGYQWASLSSTQEFPFAFSIKRSFQNILPSAFFRLRFSDNQNLFFAYRANTIEPSVVQLQEVLNNSNPLLLSIGNQSLNQEFQHTFIFRYSSVDVQAASSFFVLLNGNFRWDYIGNSTVIATRDTLLPNRVRLLAGTQLTQPVNLDGYYTLRSLVTYGVPLPLIQTNLNLSFGANLTRTPALLNGNLNIALTPSINAGITLSSNISEKIDFTLSTTTNYGTTQNSLQPQLNGQFLNQQSRAKINFIFGDGFVFQTDLTHQYFSGLSQDFNQNFVLWNASFGKKFFDDRAELRLTVFDILNQNNSIQRNITESFIEDTRTDILQRYAILTFTYNLRQN